MPEEKLDRRDAVIVAATLALVFFTALATAEWTRYAPRATERIEVIQTKSELIELGEGVVARETIDGRVLIECAPARED